MKQYIKIKIQDVIEGLVSIYVDSGLAALMSKQGFNIKEGDDIGTKLIYYDIEGYRYLLLQARDLKNKGRLRVATAEEEQELRKYCINKGFVIVDELPEQDII